MMHPALFAAVGQLCYGAGDGHGADASAGVTGSLLRLLAPSPKAAVTQAWPEAFTEDARLIQPFGDGHDVPAAPTDDVDDVEEEAARTKGTTDRSAASVRQLRTFLALRIRVADEIKRAAATAAAAVNAAGATPTTNADAVVDAAFVAEATGDHYLLRLCADAAPADASRVLASRLIAAALTDSDASFAQSDQHASSGRDRERGAAMDMSAFCLHGNPIRPSRSFEGLRTLPDESSRSIAAAWAAVLLPRAVWGCLTQAVPMSASGISVQGPHAFPMAVGAIVGNVNFVVTLLQSVDGSLPESSVQLCLECAMACGNFYRTMQTALESKCARFKNGVVTMAASVGDDEAEKRSFFNIAAAELRTLKELLLGSGSGGGGGVDSDRGEGLVVALALAEATGRVVSGGGGSQTQTDPKPVWGPGLIERAVKANASAVLATVLAVGSTSSKLAMLERATAALAAGEKDTLARALNRVGFAAQKAALALQLPVAAALRQLTQLPPLNAAGPQAGDSPSPQQRREGARSPWASGHGDGGEVKASPFGLAAARGLGDAATLLLLVGDVDGDCDPWLQACSGAVDLERAYRAAREGGHRAAARFTCCDRPEELVRGTPLANYAQVLHAAVRGELVATSLAVMERAMRRRERLLQHLASMDADTKRRRNEATQQNRGADAEEADWRLPSQLLSDRIRRQVRRVAGAHGATTGVASDVDSNDEEDEPSELELEGPPHLCPPTLVAMTVLMPFGMIDGADGGQDLLQFSLLHAPSDKKGGRNYAVPERVLSCIAERELQELPTNAPVTAVRDALLCTPMPHRVHRASFPLVPSGPVNQTPRWRLGLDLNAIDADGRTAVYLLAGMEAPGLLRRLVEAGATVMIPPAGPAGQQTRQPLFYAIGTKRPDTVKLLIELGSDANACDSNGRTAVARALSLCDRLGHLHGDAAAALKALVDTAGTSLRCTRALDLSLVVAARLRECFFGLLRSFAAPETIVGMADCLSSLAEQQRKAAADATRTRTAQQAGVATPRCHAGHDPLLCLGKIKALAEIRHELMNTSSTARLKHGECTEPLFVSACGTTDSFYFDLLADLWDLCMTRLTGEAVSTRCPSDDNDNDGDDDDSRDDRCLASHPDEVRLTSTAEDARLGKDHMRVARRLFTQLLGETSTAFGLLHAATLVGNVRTITRIGRMNAVLIRAAREKDASGDAAEAKSWLQDVVSPLGFDETGATPLLYAVGFAPIAVPALIRVAEMVEEAADPAGTWRSPDLQKTVADRFANLATRLVNARDCYGVTPLGLLAATSRDPHVAEVLIDHGASNAESAVWTMLKDSYRTASTTIDLSTTSSPTPLKRRAPTLPRPGHGFIEHTRTVALKLPVAIAQEKHRMDMTPDALRLASRKAATDADSSLGPRLAPRTDAAAAAHIDPLDIASDAAAAKPHPLVALLRAKEAEGGFAPVRRDAEDTTAALWCV